MSHYNEAAVKPSRPKHQLPSKNYTIVVHMTDQPAPGETYLSLDDIVRNIFNSGDLDAGVSITVNREKDVTWL
jgi:hypothetical protein